MLMLYIFCYDGQVMVEARNITIPLESSSEGTSQPKSPIDVSDDKQDETLLKLNEDELRVLQKANSIQCIEGMQMLPLGLIFRFTKWYIYHWCIQLLFMTSRGWRLSSPMDIGQVHWCSMFLSPMSTGKRGL